MKALEDNPGHTAASTYTHTLIPHTLIPHTLCMHTAEKMAVLFGTYSLPFFAVSIFIAALTYITFKLLSGYLHKWFEMKPIPGVEGTYPFIGNALMLKNDAGGKRAANTLRQEADCKCTRRHSGTQVVQKF